MNLIKTKSSVFSTHRRKVSIFLLGVMVLEILHPLSSFALTGGPSQPEVQSFQPIGSSDMVDTFSGDFSYNIPLLKVGDYPVNISYSSGIGMDQEASWVGLGWNINPGVINRNLRGIPDDFSGDVIEKQYNIKPNRTYGVNAAGNLELAGSDMIKLGYSLGIQYNNYNGITVNQGLNLSLSAGGGAGIGLGVNSSSDDGLSIQPSLSFSSEIAKTDKSSTSLGLSVGTAFNSRGGLQSLTISASATTTVNASENNKNEEKDKSKNEGQKADKPNVEDNKGLEEQIEGPSETFASSASFDIGMQTYTPTIPMNLINYSITASFDVGGEAYTSFPIGNIGGFYSTQSLASTKRRQQAFGYMNAERANGSPNVILDFNREKDGSFTKNTPSLPLASFTYDVFSVSGQGISGSYRPFRSEIGHVYDPQSYTTSSGGSIGGEIGAGGTFHGGVDISVTTVNGSSGKWSENNLAADWLPFRKRTENLLYEPYYLKEANERSVDSDPKFYASVGGDAPQRFKLTNRGKEYYSEPIYIDHNGDELVMNMNYRKKREKRNQNISILKKIELEKFALVNPGLNQGYRANHHIGEITTTATNGSRYVYGIAAYNSMQSEVTFAIGSTLYNSGNAITGDISTGLIDYDHSGSNPDNSTKNKKGLDNYFSKVDLPGYAHSYLLTALLSPEYVDADNDPGPSDGDFGNWTKFNYSRIDNSNNYKWRTPFDKDKASYNEGLKSDFNDDKANYIYGEKEIWYLDQIVSKDYIATFHRSDRLDGRGVANDNGGLDAIPQQHNIVEKLDSIRLFSKRDFDLDPTKAIPIQTVHFTYDYQLCPGAINSVAPNQGKLTLKGIYFTYKNSYKAALSPYKFSYCTQFIDENDVSLNNFTYDITGYDRWGNYKENPIPVGPVSIFDPLYNNEYPYVLQGDQERADMFASAWSLTEIKLPSGGVIKIEYESDDYAFVQNKRAGQMFHIVGFGDSASPTETTSSPQSRSCNYEYFFFEKQPGIHIDEYVKGVDKLYFRFLMDLREGHYDFVSGYAKIESYGVAAGNSSLGYVRIGKITTNDNGGSPVSPMMRAAIQYGRIHNPKLVWSDDTPFGGEPTNFGLDVLQTLLSSNVARDMMDMALGANEALFRKDVGLKFITHKSWIRLNNPDKKKFGGGSRVKKIQILDNWDTMTGTENASVYGQEYFYKMIDNTSSGVASYEPQLGGDENPWRQPDFFDIKKTLAPDDNFFMEAPYGESFFPSPSVGYRRVTVRNLVHDNVELTRHATGYTVNEYFTAYDFPTITKMTRPVDKPMKSPKVSLGSILKVLSYDFMTATQGFTIEVNDMHGKPKSVKVYQEGAKDPITSVEYFYKSEPYLTNSSKLINEATVIHPDGEVEEKARYGTFFDMVSDMREMKSTTEGVTTAINADGFLAGVFPVVIPIVWPGYAKEETRFRSATTTKVIQRFGILDSTVAKDLGSIVTTSNLAYDSETGDPLLTKTTTNFNDEIYSLKVPAYYYYDRMGQAYKNVGFTTWFNNINNGKFNVINAKNYFVIGDELAVKYGPGSDKRAWVKEIGSNYIIIIDKNGNEITAVNGTIKIIRSGRRNTTGVDMMSITSLKNPLYNIRNNVYEQVLSASAIEFYDEWKTYCDCFSETGTGYPNTNNEYVRLLKGNFLANKSYKYLTDRTQSKYNNNTNIRRDGTYTSFTPFYKLSGGKWVKDYSNWTYNSEITEYSPFDVELENKDALNRYSAATYGYAQTLPTAVGSNSRYRDIGFDGFEDYGFSECADNHFKFKDSNLISDEESHTGTHSIKVEQGQTVSMIKQIDVCDEIACDITFEVIPQQNQGNTFHTLVNIIGGQPPYSISHHSPHGNLSLGLVNNGNSVLVAHPDPNGTILKIVLEVVDSKGCVQIYQFGE